MATRFYLPSTGVAAVSPAFGSGWESTANADRIAMVTTRINSAMTTKDGAGDAGADQEQLLRQYVSAPLAAQTLSGSVKGVARFISTTAGNGRPAIRIAKCANDGTSVVEILAITFSSNNIDLPPATATSLTNRRFEEGADDFVLNFADVTITAGDRLIVEPGYRDHTTNTGRFVSISFGDNSGTDLPEDETTTAANNPWVEFSADISFQGAGAFSLLAEQGTYNLTGQTAELRAGGFLTAEFGSYSLLGSDAQRDITSVAESGSYALTGQALVLTTVRSLIIEAGIYNLSGQNMSLLYSNAATTVMAGFIRAMTFGMRLFRR